MISERHSITTNCVIPHLPREILTVIKQCFEGSYEQEI